MTINVLDDQRNRQAATRYRSLSPFPVPDGGQLLCRELLRHMANSTCERDREAARWLRLIVEHDATVQEIATLRGSTQAAVRSLLRLATKKMQALASGRCNFTAEGL